MNLFNRVLALFHVKFACILAIRYLVFRWELCKGCVWESVKKTQVVCIQRSLVTDSRLATHQNATRVKHAGNWRVTTAGVLHDKKYNLAKQLSRDSNLWLIPLARLSRQNALLCRKMTFHIPHVHYYKYPYTHEM